MRPLFVMVAVFALVSWDLAHNGGSDLLAIKSGVRDFLGQLGL